MRLLIAMMKHETNTFSPVPTPLARFGGAASAVGRPANTSVYL
ncbi:MAG TPA: M81 family metallopeptidase [Stellaceae bacterium]|jgi:microcystin degradation protein MlrC|nr:M81 family metallopeptidase [Stellaceae bacterium]